MSVKSPPRILVVGCGSIGERHIRNLKTSTSADVIACERDKNRGNYISTTYGITVFRDYKRALQMDIDAVFVCTPTKSHISPALAAIQQGCHVFIEKPLSHTLNGIDNLIDEAMRRNLIVMVGFNLRFHPALKKMRALVEDQQIGRLIAANVHANTYFLYRAPSHSWEDYRQDYAARKIGGGVILDSATHHIEYLSSLFGSVKEVFCYSGKLGNLELEAEDLANILMKFKSGALVNLHVNFIQQPYQTKYHLIGEKGTITWEVADNTVMIFSETENKWRSFPPQPGFDYNETYIQEINHFLACISKKERPYIDGIRGKTILQIALAAKKSGVTGRPVVPEEIGKKQDIQKSM